MATYMIVTAQVHDRAAFIEGYCKAAAALVARFGGRYVLRAPGALSLEGSFADGASVVVSEWPDRAAALAFWNSPEYATVKPMRHGIADAQVLLIEAPRIDGRPEV